MRCASSSSPARGIRPSGSTAISAFRPRALTRHSPARRPPARTPRARDRPEEPLAQRGVRREQRSVGVLQVRVAGRDQSDALGAGRESSSPRSSRATQAARLPRRTCSRSPAAVAQRRSACGRATPAQSRSPAPWPGRRSAGSGGRRRRRPDRARGRGRRAGGGAASRAGPRSARREAPQHRGDVVALAASAPRQQLRADAPSQRLVELVPVQGAAFVQRRPRRLGDLRERVGRGDPSPPSALAPGGRAARRARRRPSPRAGARAARTRPAPLRGSRPARGARRRARPGPSPRRTPRA